MSGVVLFDLDGTLVDADHLHYEAWRQVVQPHGIELSVEQYRTEIMGFANDIILGILLPSLSPAQGLSLVETKELLFRSMATDLVPAEGLLAFLNWLDGMSIRSGVVTNAPRANAEQELRGIGLRDVFDVLIIGDELDHAKPHPLPYLKGLSAFGADPARSVAFEDSLSGIQSAKAAGMAVVGLTTGLSAERLIAEGASIAIANFADQQLRAFVTARLQ